MDPDVPLDRCLSGLSVLVSFLGLFVLGFFVSVWGLSEACLLPPDQLVVFLEVRLRSHRAPDLSAPEDVATY